MSLPTVANITAYYLYGQLNKPNLVPDRLRSLAMNDEVDFPITIDVYEYMATVGRFASLSSAKIVQDFFVNGPTAAWGYVAGQAGQITIGKLFGQLTGAEPRYSNINASFSVSHYAVLQCITVTLAITPKLTYSAAHGPSPPSRYPRYPASYNTAGQSA